MYLLGEIDFEPGKFVERPHSTSPLAVVHVEHAAKLLAGA